MNFTTNRFIPSCEGQTVRYAEWSAMLSIHPFLRRADILKKFVVFCVCDSSLLAKGRRVLVGVGSLFLRFIPSCEGQTMPFSFALATNSIHPFLRRADGRLSVLVPLFPDSSLLAKGRHYKKALQAVHQSIHPFLRRADTQCLCGFQPP